MVVRGLQEAHPDAEGIAALFGQGLIRRRVHRKRSVPRLGRGAWCGRAGSGRIAPAGARGFRGDGRPGVSQSAAGGGSAPRHLGAGLGGTCALRRADSPRCRSGSRAAAAHDPAGAVLCRGGVPGRRWARLKGDRHGQNTGPAEDIQEPAGSGEAAPASAARRSGSGAPPTAARRGRRLHPVPSGRGPTVTGTGSRTPRV